jgi:hypothetical protein
LDESPAMPPGDLNRRSFLHGLAGGTVAAFTTPGLFAQQLVETGTTTEGTFHRRRPGR